MISFIIEDRATEAVNRLATLLENRQELHQVLAVSALTEVQKCFVALAQSERNKLGAPSSGFWNRMLSGTTATGTLENGTVDAPREVAMRWHGGELRPVNHRFLTLPNRAEAYNRKASEFNLKFAVLPQGGPALLLVEDRKGLMERRSFELRRGKAVSISKKEKVDVKAGTVMYWLREEVNIPPTPEVMPEEAALSYALRRGASDYLRRHQ